MSGMENSILILKSLHKLQITGQYCDVELHLWNGDMMLAHSCVLALVSKLFQQMINESTKISPNSNNKRIDLPKNITTPMIKYILQKIYSGEVQLLEDDVISNEIEMNLNDEKIEDAATALGVRLVKMDNLKKLTDQSKNVDIDVETNNYKENEKFKIKCYMCGKCCRTKSLLKSHIKHWHGASKNNLDQIESTHLDSSADNAQSSAQEKRRNNKKKQRIVCLACNKTFTNVYVMKLHSKIHTGNEQYSCTICLKKFPYKGSLTNHYRSHDEVKPFVCSICGKSFSQKVHAKEHESQHTGLKRYQCSEPNCLKWFSQKSGLARHKQTIHEKIKPYICETCGQSFTRKTKLNEHNRCHTGEKPYVCEFCNAAFKSNRSLKNHKHKNHQVCVPNNQIGISHMNNFYPTSKVFNKNNVPNTQAIMPANNNQSSPITHLVEATSMDTLAAVAEQEMTAQGSAVMESMHNKLIHSTIPIHIQEQTNLSQEILLNFNNGDIPATQTTNIQQHISTSFHLNPVHITNQRIIHSGLFHPQKLVNEITATDGTELPTLILPEQQNNTTEANRQTVDSSIQIWNSQHSYHT